MFNNQLLWIEELLNRAMFARSCRLNEEAISLCNIAEKQYQELLNHPNLEIRMKTLYSAFGVIIANVRDMIADDWYWNPCTLKEVDFNSLLFSDNDQTIKTDIDTNNLQT